MNVSSFKKRFPYEKQLYSRTANPEDPANACNLLYCGFVSQQDWARKNDIWNYWACDPVSGSGGGCCTSGYIACATRQFDGSSYSAWGYAMTLNGGYVSLGDAPKIR